MKIIKLPNGFVLDLDTVKFIGKDFAIPSPFCPSGYTGDVEFIIFCVGMTTITISTTEEQSKQIHEIIKKHLKEKKKEL